MYCPKCGKPSADASEFCASCGHALSAQTPIPQVPVAGTVGAPLSTTPETSGKAIASLVCGFLSFIFPAAVAAIILGHISRSEIRKSNGRLSGSGMALTGLIFGYLGISFIPILIIAAIAIPNLLRARMAANEASAVGAIRTINAAEVAYATAHPDGGYTCTMRDLASATGAGSMEELASGERHGYVFRLDGCSPQTYVVMAAPRTVNQTGVRAFCSTQDGVIRYDSKGSESECVEHGAALQ